MINRGGRPMIELDDTTVVSINAQVDALRARHYVDLNEVMSDITEVVNQIDPMGSLMIIPCDEGITAYMLGTELIVIACEDKSPITSVRYSKSYCDDVDITSIVAKIRYYSEIKGLTKEVKSV